MKEDDALRAIKGRVGANRVKFRRHAHDRMNERGASVDDVLFALDTATRATWQDDRENWRVSGGTDEDREPLGAIVALEDDVIVITVF